LQSQDETIAVFGEGDRNLKRLKEKLTARILARGDSIRIEGEKADVQKAENLIRDLLAIYRQGGDVGMEEVERGLEMLENGNPTDSVFVEAPATRDLELPRRLRPKTKGQKLYLEAINSSDITFGIGPAGTGKCVAGPTLVLTQCGLVPISSLADGVVLEEQRRKPVRIHGVDGKEWASHVYNGGVKDTLRVTTRHGFQIEGTPEHPLMTLNERGELEWIRMDQLRPGMPLALNRGAEMWGENTQIHFSYQPNSNDRSSNTIQLEELDTDLAYFMGLIVGDGCVTRRGWVLYCSRDESLRAEFARMATRLNLHVTKHGEDQRINSVQLWSLLESLGVKSVKAHEKTVPESVLRAPREHVVAFLQGMFDTDGTVSARDGYPSLSSSSETLIRTVQQLLLNLGIVGKLWRKTTTHRDTYTLEMRGMDARRFFNAVGFRLERKQILSQALKTRQNTNLDLIPNLASSIREAVSAQKVSHGDHKWLHDYKTGRRRPSYPQLRRILEVCHAPSPAKRRLEMLTEKHWLWSTVQDITPARAHVYDLTVPGSHSFTAAGFISHNSYLAVAMAVAAFKAKRVKRIILTRPAVEAGERLGFLPGDLQAKIDPYLRPLYDALFDMIDADRFESYLSSGAIEVAPLAFMRGRTLNDAFIILDEAQNTTPEQMKMFLTRMGFSSKVVVTGDITQVDLPKNVKSGLSEARRILQDIDGINFVYFTESDVVRHPLVGRIVRAYDKLDEPREH
jgi:phosphate starvation-inducible protein PhoH/intein/homing endonuclease